MADQFTTKDGHPVATLFGVVHTVEEAESVLVETIARRWINDDFGAYRERDADDEHALIEAFEARGVEFEELLTQLWPRIEETYRQFRAETSGIASAPTRLASGDFPTLPAEAVRQRESSAAPASEAVRPRPSTSPPRRRGARP